MTKKFKLMKKISFLKKDKSLAAHQITKEANFKDNTGTTFNNNLLSSTDSQSKLENLKESIKSSEGFQKLQKSQLEQFQLESLTSDFVPYKSPYTSGGDEFSMLTTTSRQPKNLEELQQYLMDSTERVNVEPVLRKNFLETHQGGLLSSENAHMNVDRWKDAARENIDYGKGSSLNICSDDYDLTGSFDRKYPMYNLDPSLDKKPAARIDIGQEDFVDAIHNKEPSLENKVYNSISLEDYDLTSSFDEKYPVHSIESSSEEKIIDSHYVHSDSSESSLEEKVDVPDPIDINMLRAAFMKKQPTAAELPLIRQAMKQVRAEKALSNANKHADTVINSCNDQKIAFQLKSILKKSNVNGSIKIKKTVTFKEKDLPDKCSKAYRKKHRDFVEKLKKEISAQNGYVTMPDDLTIEEYRELGLKLLQALGDRQSIHKILNPYLPGYKPNPFEEDFDQEYLSNTLSFHNSFPEVIKRDYPDDIDDLDPNSKTIYQTIHHDLAQGIEMSDNIPNGYFPYVEPPRGDLPGIPYKPGPVGEYNPRVFIYGPGPNIYPGTGPKLPPRVQSPFDFINKLMPSHMQLNFWPFKTQDDEFSEYKVSKAFYNKFLVEIDLKYNKEQVGLDIRPYMEYVEIRHLSLKQIEFLLDFYLDIEQALIPKPWINPSRFLKGQPYVKINKPLHAVPLDKEGKFFGIKYDPGKIDPIYPIGLGFLILSGGLTKIELAQFFFDVFEKAKVNNYEFFPTFVDLMAEPKITESFSDISNIITMSEYEDDMKLLFFCTLTEHWDELVVPRKSPTKPFLGEFFAYSNYEHADSLFTSIITSDIFNYKLYEFLSTVPFMNFNTIVLYLSSMPATLLYTLQAGANSQGEILTLSSFLAALGDMGKTLHAIKTEFLGELEIVDHFMSAIQSDSVPCIFSTGTQTDESALAPPVASNDTSVTNESSDEEEQKNRKKVNYKNLAKGLLKIGCVFLISTIDVSTCGAGTALTIITNPGTTICLNKCIDYTCDYLEPYISVPDFQFGKPLGLKKKSPFDDFR